MKNLKFYIGQVITYKPTPFNIMVGTIKGLPTLVTTHYIVTDKITGVDLPIYEDKISSMSIGEGVFKEDIWEGQRVVVKGSNGGYHGSGKIIDIQNCYMVQVLLDDLRTITLPYTELIPPTYSAPVDLYH